MFLPSVPPLLALAGQMEVERDHALDGPAKERFLAGELLAAGNREADEDTDDTPAFHRAAGVRELKAAPAPAPAVPAAPREPSAFEVLEALPQGAQRSGGRHAGV